MLHSPLPTVEVLHAVMQMHWDDLTFLHWDYDPDVIQSLLPKGLTVDTYQGRGWISLVPFTMRVIVPGDRFRLPFIGRFPETNVRTYVRAADGTQGIWFFSLDAGSALATLGGRVGYRLPYMWSDMTVERNVATIVYRCSRRFPDASGASSNIKVNIGKTYEPSDLTDLDHWLSARWRLYSVMFGQLWGAHAVHQQWPSQHATVQRCNDTLVIAAGLPYPEGAPIVQFAERVTVRIGRPYRLGRQHKSERQPPAADIKHA